MTPYFEWWSIPPEFYTAAALVLAISSFTWLLNLLSEDDPMIDAITYWLIRLALAVAAVTLPLYYYPPFDRWWYLTTDNPFYHGLSRYVVGAYGAVHYPSVFLVATMVIGLAAVPSLARVIEFIIMAIARELAGRQPAEEAT